MNELDNKRFLLIKAMLEFCSLWNDRVANFLDNAKFVSQDDGGMGSFSITAQSSRIGYRDCAEAKYKDSDGVNVIIALIIGEDGLPTDLDFWKIDSSSLIEFPDPTEITINCKKM